MMTPFALARLPRIRFGSGEIRALPELIRPYGEHFLLVTGKRSFTDTSLWQDLQARLHAAALQWQHMIVEGEPSPQVVDEAVQRFKAQELACVVAIGGGSVLDAAKAIAGLLPHGNSVMDHLEGVGPELPYQGPALPFIACPTTAGTGSEATKNAVLSVQGENGFKKSFRDEQLVAQVALLDPDLLRACPASLIAANGMDAFTQLLESYVSLRSNPLTDALALSGIEAVRDSLLSWYQATVENADPDQPALREARSRMAYASLLSGICLAQTGLGSVHGLASPLGAFFPMPHGVVCGTLVAVCTEVNLKALNDRDAQHPALDKYARVSTLLHGRHFSNLAAAHQALLDYLTEWTQAMQLPRLSRYGMQESDIERVVSNSRGSSMKTNPIVLSDEEIGHCLHARL